MRRGVGRCVFAEVRNGVRSTGCRSAATPFVRPASASLCLALTLALDGQAHESQVPGPDFIGPFLTNIAAMVANTSTIAAASSAPGATAVQYAEGFLAYF